MMAKAMPPPPRVVPPPRRVAPPVIVAKAMPPPPRKVAWLKKQDTFVGAKVKCGVDDTVKTANVGDGNVKAKHNTVGIGVKTEDDTDDTDDTVPGYTEWFGVVDTPQTPTEATYCHVCCYTRNDYNVYSFRFTSSTHNNREHTPATHPHAC